MHIAMLAGEYPPLWGGLGSAAYQLTSALAEMGHRVTVITRRSKSAVTRPQIDGVRVLEVKWLYAPMAFTRSYGKHALKELKRLHGLQPVDVVHLHCPLIALNSKEIEGIREDVAPVVSSLHGSWLGERDGILAARKGGESAVWRNPNDLAILLTASRYARYERDAARSSNICIANSAATRLDFIARYDTPADWKCEVVHWGVDPHLFRPTDHDEEEDQLEYERSRIRFGAADEAALRGDAATTTPLLLAVGRLVGRKGFRFLLRAMPAVIERYPAAKLLIIGRGHMRKTLEKQARKLGISASVRIESGMPFEQLAVCYRAADLVVYPSYYEGQGLIPLEAMASGTPVVTVNDGPLPEMVDDVVGALYTPGDVASLADAICFELAEPEKRTAQARAGRERILNDSTFSHQRTAERILQLYELVCET